jgi:hypothetical protein
MALCHDFRQTKMHRLVHLAVIWAAVLVVVPLTISWWRPYYEAAELRSD